MSVVLVTLAATLLIQSGYFLWKVCAGQLPVIGQVPLLRALVAYFLDWRWSLGLAATIAGWLLFVRATSLGDISLVQPLMSVGDLLLVVMAVTFLHERLGRAEWLGVIAIVLGAAGLSIDPMPSGAPVMDVPRLWIGMVLLTLAAAALVLASRRSKLAEFELALVVGAAFGAGAALTKALTVRSALAGAPALSLTTLFDPVLLAVVVSNVAGLVFLQMAFQRGRASVVVPLQLAVCNGVTVLAGVLVFGEAVGLLRGSAIVLILIGTALLHRSSKAL